jgi:hypothetical protein
MRRYYFDLQFGDQQPSQDQEGTALPDVEAAQLEAALRFRISPAKLAGTTGISAPSQSMCETTLDLF